LQLPAGVGNRPRGSRRYFRRVHLEVPLHHDVSQKQYRDVDLVLLCLHEEGVLKEALQDGLDVVNVFLL